LIEDLDLLEMHKETRAVIDETIEDRFIVDALTSLPQSNEPVGNEIMTPFKSNRTQSTAADTAKPSRGPIKQDNASKEINNLR